MVGGSTTAVPNRPNQVRTGRSSPVSPRQLAYRTERTKFSAHPFRRVGERPGTPLSLLRAFLELPRSNARVYRVLRKPVRTVRKPSLPIGKLPNQSRFGASSYGSVRKTQRAGIGAGEYDPLAVLARRFPPLYDERGRGFPGATSSFGLPDRADEVEPEARDVREAEETGTYVPGSRAQDEMNAPYVPVVRNVARDDRGTADDRPHLPPARNGPRRGVLHLPFVRPQGDEPRPGRPRDVRGVPIHPKGRGDRVRLLVVHRRGPQMAPLPLHRRSSDRTGAASHSSINRGGRT